MNLELKILVVDDFSTMRRIVKNALKQIGFSNFIEADSGLAALEQIKNNKVDLIISDWNMPGMDGLAFLKEIRGNEATKGIPFVMVTAEAQKINVLEAVRAGVSNYIIKPFSGDDVKRKLEETLKGA